MTPREITDQLSKAINELSAQNVKLDKIGKKKAEAEKKYRIALQQKLLQLRADGKSVSLASELARGDVYVAERKQDRDIAESEWTVCREKIKDLRDEIGILRSLLTHLREEAKNTI